MGGPAISLRGVAKRYRISVGGVNRLSEAVAERVRRPFARARREEFWALRDLDFDIAWGEAVGIVGRNGAGKSTLLKLLTRVTAPTTGRIELAGRVGSLLEVGTGFHPELTGRENVFLNGALLGMTRAEIRRRFDEIVEFSGVERFLETPVKRYSSGMYVRLAFSVAAHLETEILAIDEVLAVGDAEFQRKSVEKMRGAAREGRTVLFVSHQAQMVSSLCSSALFLAEGRLAYEGSVEGALSAYRDGFAAFRDRQLTPEARNGTGELRFSSVRVVDSPVAPADDKLIEFTLGPSHQVAGRYFVSFHINDEHGDVLAQCDSRLVGQWFDPSRPQSGTLRLRNLWLKPGRYVVDAFCCQAGILDSWEAADVLDVSETNPYPELLTDEAISKASLMVDFEYREGVA